MLGEPGSSSAFGEIEGIIVVSDSSSLYHTEKVLTGESRLFLLSVQIVYNKMILLQGGNHAFFVEIGPGRRAAAVFPDGNCGCFSQDPVCPSGQPARLSGIYGGYRQSRRLSPDGAAGKGSVRPPGFRKQ